MHLIALEKKSKKTMLTGKKWANATGETPDSALPSLHENKPSEGNDRRLYSESPNCCSKINK